MTKVFLSPEQAWALVQAGAAPIDAQGKSAWLTGRIPGSGALDWLTLRAGFTRTGLLSEDLAALGKAIRQAGVRAGEPVVVLGKAHQGWGEEARIFWMLEHLGHPRVHIVDGGIGAWRAAGLPLAKLTSAAGAGDFEPEWGGARVRLEEVIQAHQASSHTLWDCRSLEEFGGATPFGEARPGHIPGARHLHWKELMDAEGRLRPEPELRALLADFAPPVVPLCTGGVRAAYCYAVLRELGIDAALYDGSMWEWAGRPELPLSSGPDGRR